MGKYSRPDKKLWMRVAVLGVALILILAYVLMLFI